MKSSIYLSHTNKYKFYPLTIILHYIFSRLKKGNFCIFSFLVTYSFTKRERKVLLKQNVKDTDHIINSSVICVVNIDEINVFENSVCLIVCLFSNTRKHI